MKEFNGKFDRLLGQINREENVFGDLAATLMYKNKLDPSIFPELAHVNNEPLRVIRSIVLAQTL